LIESRLGRQAAVRALTRNHSLTNATRLPQLG